MATCVSPSECRIGLANGGDLQTIRFDEGETVAQGLGKAGIEPRPEQQVLVNGQPVDPASTPLQEQDTVLVAQPIEGG